MSAVNRKLAACSLERVESGMAVRRRHAMVYYECLREFGVIKGVVPSALPQSNFPIRVPAAFRAPMREYLKKRGIDTGILFGFSARSGLDREQFPNTVATGEEIILLPVGEEVTTDEVRWIFQCVVDGLRKLHVEISD